VGRAADPSVGRSFIAATGRILSASGSLWMVANRHLPYEATLQGVFTKVEEISGDSRFKILHAQRPFRGKSARSSTATPMRTRR
jgi:16S rRNA (guanine1207-N2)-methyltransferase